MNVLLIAPRFFGYEHEIQAGLETRGCTVDFLPDRPFDTPLMKALFRHARGAFLSAADGFYRQSIEGLGRNSYDVILVVQGEGLSAKSIRLLRSTYPGARLIYYTWDNLRNKPNSVGNLSLYDVALSFDRSDAATYGMSYRPLFFSEGFEAVDTVPAEDIDLSFIGTIHSDRLAVVRSVKASLLGTDANLYTYLYMQAEWVYRLRSTFNSDFRGMAKSEFRFEPLAKDVVKSVFRRSRAVLDIEHPLQSGLTMRTLETLGAGKKLVTTNRSVLDSDFYSADNILVLDRNVGAGVTLEFLRAPNSPVPAEVTQRYSLQRWLEDVVGR